MNNNFTTRAVPLQTICFINLLMYAMLTVSTAMYVAFKAIVLCTCGGMRRLSKHLLHIVVKGSNLRSYLYVEVNVIDVECDSYFGVYGRIY